MRLTIAGLFAAVSLTFPGQASAQEPWSFEFRGGAAFATEDLGVLDLDTGLGFEGTVAYRLMPHLLVYGGWDWHHFTTDTGASEIDVEETGYAFGARFEHPIGTGPLLRLRVGGTVNHIELEDDEGDLVGDSEHGLGFEGGAGLAIPLGEKWLLTPGARFRALSREVVAGEGDVDLRYVAVEIGLARSF